MLNPDMDSMIDNTKIKIQINIKTYRFLASVIAAVLFFGAGLLLGRLKVGVVLMLLFVFSGSVGGSYKLKKDISSYILSVGYFAVTAFLTFYFSQYLLDQGIDYVDPLKVLLNTLIIFSIYMVLLIIFGQVVLSAAVGTGFVLFLTTINYFVTSFRGNELAISDIVSIQTALNVGEHYKFEPTALMLISWGILTAWLIWSVGFIHVSFDNKFKVGIFSVAMMIASISCVFIFGNQYRSYTFLKEGSLKNGYIFNLVKQIPQLFVSKPAGYSAASVRSIEDEYIKENNESSHLCKTAQPDIIVIMDEAFADLNIVGDQLAAETEVFPFIHSLHENTIKGYALSSVFGGNTPNSEYEFLTGNSMAFLPSGSIPFQQYIDEPTYSVASYLKKMGYRNAAFHPYLANGWEREKVYPLLGFDEMYFLDDFPQEDMIRELVSDRELFEEMVSRYESFRGESDESIFLYGVTMQNHGGYEYSGYENTVNVSRYSNSEGDVSQYLSLLQETDRAVEWLIGYFEESDRDVVVVFFGDHMPGFTSEFYADLNHDPIDTAEETCSLYKVPFFVWTNRTIESEETGLTSLNYLSNFMYRAAGLPLPPYGEFLEDVRKEISAVNAELVCYDDGEVRYLEDQNSNVLSRYEQLAYNSLFDDRKSGFFITE